MLSMIDKNEAAQLLSKIHIWVLVSEKLFKSVKTMYKNTELYNMVNYADIMKLFSPTVHSLKKYQLSDDYISKLITINSNTEKLMKRTIQNINYKPIDNDFIIYFTVSVANGILLSAKIASHNAFSGTEYDLPCKKVDELYHMTNSMTDKMEMLYLQRFKLDECDKHFNNDVRTVIDKCIFSICDLLSNIGLDVRTSKLYSPLIKQYTPKEVVRYIKHKLHLSDKIKLNPEYMLTTTGCIQFNEAV